MPEKFCSFCTRAFAPSGVRAVALGFGSGLAPDIVQRLLPLPQYDTGDQPSKNFVVELRRTAAVYRGLLKPLREDVVRTAEVRISDDDFGQRLKDMRLWLDSRRFEPSAFTYFYLDPGMMVRVCFDIDNEAQAFAAEFGGFLIKTRGAGLAA